MQKKVWWSGWACNFPFWRPLSSGQRSPLLIFALIDEHGHVQSLDGQFVLWKQITYMKPLHVSCTYVASYGVDKTKVWSSHFFIVFTFIDNPVLLTKDFLLKCKLLKKIKVGLAPANWCIITFFFFPFLLRKSDKNGAKLGLWWTVLCFEKRDHPNFKTYGTSFEKRESVLCCQGIYACMDELE